MITAFVCLGLAGFSGCWFLLKKASPALCVTVYRKIGRAPRNSRPASEWTSLKRLEKDFIFLTRRGFTTISPKELGKTRAQKPVLLAFAGGYRSFFTDVFPLLKKYQLKACVFLVADTVGRYDRWQDPRQGPFQNILTAEELKVLSASPLISFGTLGLSENGGPSFKITAGSSELAESISRLERLYKIPVTAIYTNEDLPADPPLHPALPVLGSKTGVNALNAHTNLRTLKPTFWGRLALWRRR